MKINITIILSIACLSISLAFIIITFILENWILVKNTDNRYGMWRACRSTTCYNWYIDGEVTFLFKMTDSFKAFQGLQSCMLGLIVITLVSLLFNLKICERILAIFIIDAILIFLALCCGLVSLIVFGVNIYDSNLHTLDWCFWLSVTASSLTFFGLVFLTAFTISQSLKPKKKDSFSSPLEETNDYPKDQIPTNNQNYIEQIPGIENYKEQLKLEQFRQEENNQYKISPRFIQNKTSSNNFPTPNNYKRNPTNPASKSSSPRYQKNTPNLSENRSKNKSDTKSSDDDGLNRSVQNQSLNEIKKSNRNYWNKKSTKHEYNHKHYEKKDPEEQIRPGYCSEPEMIEYSLDRSWVSASNNLNTSMPILDNENGGLTETFNSRHFVKLPRLIFYDGSNHYTRANIKK